MGARSRSRSYLGALGPGLVAGASDDDPSAIVTYAAAGARSGYGLLWTCTLALPLVIAAQLNADRTALATGKSLGELATERFGAGWARRGFALLLAGHLLANTLVIAADLVAVGEGVRLLVGGPAWLWPLAAGVGIVALLLSGSFAAIARVLKVLCLTLVGYVVALAFVDVDWGAVGRNLVVPRLGHGATVGLVLAVLGATLPPFVFFWQTAHRVEELREEDLGGDRPVGLPQRRADDATLKRRTSTLDVVAGMVFAVIVMFAIITVTAATGAKDIARPADLARALEPVAGGGAEALFAAGFVSTGVLAVPVLAGAGAAAVAGFLGREWGFSRSVRDAPVFYGLVGIGTAIGVGLGVAGIDPVRLLVAAATLNGATSAPLLAVVMVLSGDRERLGAHRPGPVLRVLGWAAVALMAVAAIGGAAAALA